MDEILDSLETRANKEDVFTEATKGSRFANYVIDRTGVGLFALSIEVLQYVFSQV